MGEVLAVDVGAARVLIDACARASFSFAERAAAARSTLLAVGLPATAANLLDTIADELATLERFVRATVERSSLADRFGASVTGSVWFAAMRADWRAAEAALRSALPDGTAARPVAAGPFSLADSMVSVPRHTWLELGVLPDGCAAFGTGAHYVGGGAVRGPDGELWPIVIPQLVAAGGTTFTIDADLPPNLPAAASLGGVDPGWVLVGYHVGVEEFIEPASPVLATATGLAVASGLAVPPTPDDAALVGVRFRAGSRPVVLGPVDVRGGSDPSVAELSQSLTSGLVTSEDGEPAPDPVHTGHINLPANAVTLATQALLGASTAIALGGNTRRAYEVLFEAHPDGRRRSRVQTFHLEARRDGAHLYANHLFVDDEGVLHEANARYQEGPTFRSPDVLVAGNGADELRPRPVRHTVIEVRDA